MNTDTQTYPTNPITPNQCPTCGAFGLDWQKEAIATSKRQLEAWQKMQSVAQQKETELRRYKAHADKLADALRDFIKVVRTSNIDRSATKEGLTNCDAISVASAALAAYEVQP